MTRQLPVTQSKSLGEVQGRKFGERATFMHDFRARGIFRQQLFQFNFSNDAERLYLTFLWGAESE